MSHKKRALVTAVHGGVYDLPEVPLFPVMAAPMKKSSAKRKPKADAQRTAAPRNNHAELLMQAVSRSTEVITMTGLDYKIMYVNRTFLKVYGYAHEEEIIGESVRKLLPPNVPDSVIEEMGRKAQTENGWRGEIVAMRRDGSEFPAMLSLGPIKDESGRPVGTFAIAQDITAQKQAEEQLRRSEDQMRAMLRDSAKLTELVDIFQSCQNMEEAYKITEDALRRMLPVRSGALCITSSSRNVVEAVANWGDHVATESTFSPDDCWALRRGRIHTVAESTSPLRCTHVRGKIEKGYLCVPLAAQGETLGMLYLEGPTGGLGTSIEELAEQARAIGERISLAIANLRLRETLRTQSIRDPLTGLFNRRYMEETLEREISRATRNEQPLAVLMCDIDHFKRFNDTFGHQAGDMLLRALGDFLLQRTRGQDVACRFGGEEFALILAGANLEAARQRAELLRGEVGTLVVQHGGQLLGKISLSIGVAAYPQHGRTAEHLLKAADAALYLAKTEGRDRVVVVAE